MPQYHNAAAERASAAGDRASDALEQGTKARETGDKYLRNTVLLAQALERDAAKLDQVARLIDDLRKTPEGEALIPEGFAEVWDPVWAAREAQR